VTPRGYGPGASFCPRCAAPLPGPAPTTCVGCGYQLFVNARPTAGLVLLDREPGWADGPAGADDAGPRFLALRRAAEPMIGRWETPGGFCDGWEHPADAALREAREELGVKVTIGDCLGMFVGSYEFQDEVLPVLDVFFLATLEEDAIVLDPAEATEWRWFPLFDPPPLAFATMDQAVRVAAQRLRRGDGPGPAGADERGRRV